jgi:site-specific recombinase XerD
MALGHYSDSTRINYLKELRFLFQFYSDIRPSEITYEMTVNYLVYLVKTMSCSRVKCKMAAQSFAFFFKHALNKPYSTPAVLFPAHEHKLPAVLSQEEMRSVLNSIINNKHRMLLSLMYSTGIRLMEIARIKITDIESNQMRIKITSGKGKKDMKASHFEYALNV